MQAWDGDVLAGAVHLPDGVVAVGVAAGAGKEVPVSVDAHVVGVEKTLGEMCAIADQPAFVEHRGRHGSRIGPIAELPKSDGNVFVRWLGIDEGLAGLKQRFASRQAIDFRRPLEVAALVHIEVEVWLIVKGFRRTMWAARMKADQVRAAIALTQPASHCAPDFQHLK